MTNMAERKKKSQSSGSKNVAQNSDLVDDSTISYYNRVLENIQEPPSSVEDRACFLENVFEQLGTELTKVSKCRSVANTVERLLHLSNHEQLHAVLKALSDDWETACSNASVAFVTQTILQLSTQYIAAENSCRQDNKSDISSVLYNLTDYICSFGSDIVKIVNHNSGSFVVRTLLEVLSGIVMEEDVHNRTAKKKKKDPDVKYKMQKQVAYKPSEKQLEKLKQLVTHILNMPNVNEHCYDRLSSTVLQTMIIVSKALGDVECKYICKTFLKKVNLFKGAGKTIPHAMTHTVASYLIEVLLRSVPDATYAKVLEKHFTGKCMEMAVHRSANFIVQRLLSSTRSEEQFVLIYNELSDHIEEFLARSYNGIVQQLAEGCVRYQINGEDLIQKLMKVYACYDPESRQKSFIYLVLMFKTYDLVFDKNDKQILPFAEVMYHGSLLLRTLFTLADPSQLTSLFISLPGPDLLTIACSPAGSFVCDVFLTSETVPSEHKMEFYQNFIQVYCIQLAMHKNGSRVFETAWANAKGLTRKNIAEVLVTGVNRLRSDYFGKHIWQRTAMDLFRTDPIKWQQEQKRLILEKKQQVTQVEQKWTTEFAAKKSLTESQSSLSNEHSAEQKTDDTNKKRKKKKRKQKMETEDNEDELLPVIPPKKKNKTESILEKNDNVQSNDTKIKRKKKKEKQRDSENATCDTNDNVIEVKKKHKKKKKKTES